MRATKGEEFLVGFAFHPDLGNGEVGVELEDSAKDTLSSNTNTSVVVKGVAGAHSVHIMVLDVGQMVF